MLLDEAALKKTEALISELEHQSDRGAAIVGVAWVEEELQAAIESFLVEDKKARDRLLGRSGPLSTFSSKIDLACLLGMCTKIITKDLHILREIRNDFAHNIVSKDNTALNFNSPHIKVKCLALKCVAHELITEPRLAFIRSCATLNADLYSHRFIGQKVSDGGQIFAKVEKYS